jgi:thiamine kinase-like enzyme
MINLNCGLSGCKIELIDNHTIRKYSSGIDYNLRLSKQIDKQSAFSNKIFKTIHVPKIKSTTKDQLYSFEMEYVTGYSFDQFFSFCSINDVQFIVDSLIEYFDSALSSAKLYDENDAKLKIISKIKSLEDKTDYPDYLHYLMQYVENETLNIPKSFCHGDLTFTNIIFNQKRIYLIDFLDSFLDTPLVDFVKLKQDLVYHWSLNVQKIDSLRIKQIYKKIWADLYDKYKCIIDNPAFEILDALNAFRIEPYLTNSSQRFILETIVKNCQIYENFNCSHGGTI